MPQLQPADRIALAVLLGLLGGAWIIRDGAPRYTVAAGAPVIVDQRTGEVRSCSIGYGMDRYACPVRFSITDGR